MLYWRPAHVCGGTVDNDVSPNVADAETENFERETDTGKTEQRIDHNSVHTFWPCIEKRAGTPASLLHPNLQRKGDQRNVCHCATEF